MKKEFFEGFSYFLRPSMNLLKDIQKNNGEFKLRLRKINVNY